MIVYQIRVRGGKYEDRYDNAVVAYFDKQRAFQELGSLNDELDEDTRRYDEHCNRCYDEVKSNCPYKNIVYDDDDTLCKYPYCANRIDHYSIYEAEYYIDKIEVIE